MLAEQVTSLGQHRVEPLEHAQAELPIALDRHHPRVGQAVADVGLELDPLLEIDQIELDLVGIVIQRDIGDQRVQETRLARPGLAGDQDMLRGPAAQVQVLQLGGPGPAQWHIETATAVPSPVLLGSGSDTVKRHLDATRVTSLFAHGTDDLDEFRRFGRRLDGQRQPAQLLVLPGKPVTNPCQAVGVLSKIFEIEVVRQLLMAVDTDQGVDPATSPTGGDADQPANGGVAEVDREVGHHQHLVRLGHLAGILVVLLDRLELVPQVGLEHVLHVLGEIGQLAIDMRRLCPDPPRNEQFVEVGQVHEGREIVPQSDGVDDRQSQLARRQPRQHPQHRCLQGGHGRVAALPLGLQQHAGPFGERQDRRHRDVLRNRLKLLVIRHPSRDLGEIDIERAQPHGRWNTLRRTVATVGQVQPRWKQLVTTGDHVPGRGGEHPAGGLPVLLQLRKCPLETFAFAGYPLGVFPVQRLASRSILLFDLLKLLGSFGLTSHLLLLPPVDQLLECLGKPLVDVGQFRLVTIRDLLGPSRLDLLDPSNRVLPFLDDHVVPVGELVLPAAEFLLRRLQPVLSSTAGVGGVLSQPLPQTSATDPGNQQHQSHQHHCSYQ